MSERNYYVLCDDNCRFPSMTYEQIIEAIAEATGNVPEHVEDAFITKIKEQNRNKTFKLWVGTRAEYNALSEIDPQTIYYITDEESMEYVAEITSSSTDSQVPTAKAVYTYVHSEIQNIANALEELL